MALDLASERYLLLIRQLGERRDLRRGWQSAVARELGVDRSFVSRVYGGHRARISAETIRVACEKLHLSEDFFYGARDQAEPWYGDFVAGFRSPGGEALSKRAKSRAAAEALVALVGGHSERSWTEIA